MLTTDDLKAIQELIVSTVQPMFNKLEIRMDKHEKENTQQHRELQDAIK